VKSSIPIREGRITTNQIELFYEDRGELDHPALLMVNGMGAQLIYWPDELCDAIARAGFRVIRFDNRDCGLSGDTQYTGRYSMVKAYFNYKLKRPVASAYNLHTMVDDAVGILDALNIERAHLAGFSMGGMIVQLLAATYPERALSLTSFMSTTNEPNLPGPKLSVLLSLAIPVENTKEAALKARLKFTRMVGSPGFERSAEKHLENAINNIERAYRPKAGLLHKVAVMATGGFENKLEKVAVPALIIHGDADPLVRPEGGRASAAAIPDAKLKVIKGMGHNFPDELVTVFTQMMIDHMKQSETADKKAA